MSHISKRPKTVSQEAITKFISGAPDAVPDASVAPAPAAATSPTKAKRASGRKQPISLTIDSNILEELDAVAESLGLSRASAFSLAASRFIAQEKKGA